MRSQTQPTEVFLATTALEEFWDTSKPIVFLGEWCLLYSRRSYWAALGGTLLESPYKDTNSSELSYKYIDSLYEETLSIISEKLNLIHNKNFSNRYWRILIGPWLLSYLSATYDRFLHVKTALTSYPKITTIRLSEKYFLTPKDTLDFSCLLTSDCYNLQIYSKIIVNFGVKSEAKEIKVFSNTLYKKLLKNSRSRKIISFGIKLFAKLSSKWNRTIILRSTYFSRSTEAKFAFFRFGRILLSWAQTDPTPCFDIDFQKRNALKNINIGDGEYEKCLTKLLFEDIPICFIEGYSLIEKCASDNFPMQSSAIFSANSWYYDETFKQWSADHAEKGTVLLGTQHGGNYGSLKIMPYENHEISIVDFYYSWGWTGGKAKEKLIPMPSTKLINRNVIGASNSKKEILWVATSSPRYLVQLPFLPEYYREYLEWQTRFTKFLPPEILTEIRFRPHYENYDWGTVERVKDCIPNIQIESWTTPFQKSLENCKLYVCDHLSTTFTEALAANKPTILFWNPITNPLRAEAESYFHVLRENGVLFDSPETAASALIAVYENVEVWWNDERRQQAVKLFCLQFARTDANAGALWVDELIRVSELRSVLY